MSSPDERLGLLVRRQLNDRLAPYGCGQGGVLGFEQNSPVSLRQQKFALILGVCSDPSGSFTVTRKAS